MTTDPKPTSQQWDDAPEAQQTAKYTRSRSDLTDHRRRYQQVLASLMESAHRTDHPLASSPNKEFIHELEKLTFDSLYSLVVKEGEQHPKQEHQIPAPQQPEEVQKAPSWTAERWQVSSWDAYIYHPEPNGQIAAPIEVEQQETAAPAQPQETTVFTAPEQPKQKRYKSKQSEYTARWQKKHPEQHREHSRTWRKSEKGKEYSKQYMRQYRARKKAERLAQQQSSSEEPLS